MAPLISPLFLLSGIGMILVAVCAVWLWQRGKPSLWAAVWWGALAWTVSVAIKFAAAWPMRALVWHHHSNPLTWLYEGLLTGVSECAIPLPLIWKTRLKKADWNESVAFGIGFGGIEAFLVGLASLIPIAVLLVAPNLIPSGARNAAIHQLRSLGLLSIPLAIIERASTLFIHVLASVLLIYAVRLRQQRWFWLAFAYKTAVDGVAGWAILAWKVTESIVRVAALEPLFVLFALIAVAALPSLKSRFARLELQGAGPSLLPVESEFPPQPVN